MSFQTTQQKNGAHAGSIQAASMAPAAAQSVESQPLPPELFEVLSLAQPIDLMAALRAAAARGCPWLIAASAAVEVAGLQALRDAAQRQPDALLVGYRALTRPGAWARRLRFRLQTGLRLEDPAAAMWLFPVTALAHLRPISRRGAVQAEELLVRAAWCGLPLVPVALPLAAAAPFEDAPASLAERVFVAWLHLHLVFRAMLPRLGAACTAQERDKALQLRHPLRTLRHLLASSATPRQLAAAAALGVFLGTLPLLGVQSITVLFSAALLRLNRWLALATNQLCMPPLVPALCIETGYFLRHGCWLTEISFQTLGHQALQRLWEWLLGALLLAPVLALLTAALVWLLASLVRRQLRLASAVSAQR